MGMGPWAAWCSGAVYGLGGYVLSCVNVLHIFEAVAWLPWVLAAWLGFLERPSARRAALLALLGALQISTLGGEIAIQTALAGLVLAPDWKWVLDRRLKRLAGVAALALLATAPVWLGARAILAGTVRGRGSASQEVLQYSLPPLAFAEAVVPKLLGEVHGSSSVQFWGEDLFPRGFPYLLSLYLGVVTLVLALRAGFHPRLYALAAAGVLIGMGSYGPFASVVGRLALSGGRRSSSS